MELAKERLQAQAEKDYRALLSDFSAQYMPFRSAVSALAGLDALQSLALVSHNSGYTSPHQFHPDNFSSIPVKKSHRHLTPLCEGNWNFYWWHNNVISQFNIKSSTVVDFKLLNLLKHMMNVAHTLGATWANYTEYDLRTRSVWIAPLENQPGFKGQKSILLSNWLPIEISHTCLQICKARICGERWTTSAPNKWGEASCIGCCHGPSLCAQRHKFECWFGSIMPDRDWSKYGWEVKLYPPSGPNCHPCTGKISDHQPNHINITKLAQLCFSDD